MKVKNSGKRIISYKGITFWPNETREISKVIANGAVRHFPELELVEPKKKSGRSKKDEKDGE